MMRIKVLAACAAAVVAGLAGHALGGISATATVTTAQTSAPYTYTITLHNTGTTNIGTFWFAWVPTPRSYDFLPTVPTGVNGPQNWFAYPTHNSQFPQDGYGLQWFNPQGAIAPGATATFGFTSNDSPQTLAGPAWFPPNHVTTSYVYMSFPQSDPGYQFDVVVDLPPPACVADFDDGSGMGHPDGGVTIDDLLYYLGLFSAGDAAGDIDDGSGTGTHDGGVTIDDLLYFLTHFAAGC